MSYEMCKCKRCGHVLEDYDWCPVTVDETKPESEENTMEDFGVLNATQSILAMN